MNKTATAFISFVLGAAAGFAVTWYLLKDKYAAIANEEIQEVRDYYKSKYEPETIQSDSPQTKTKEIKASIDKLVMNKISEQHDYTAYSKSNDKKNESETKNDDSEKPYIITPEEFDTIEDYELCELTFFKDQIIADNDLEIVEDLDDVIGFESLNHFGEYADDAIYVRNDKRQCDYEVLLDERTYAEAKNDKRDIL